MSLKGTPYYDMAIDAGAVSEKEREQMAQSLMYEEWKSLPLSEKMREDTTMASHYADKVAQLEAVVKPIRQLRERYRHSERPWNEIVRQDGEVIMAVGDAIRALVDGEGE